MHPTTSCAAGSPSKQVDVDELLRVFDPTPLAEPVLPAGERFDLPAAGVGLRCLRRGDRHVAAGHELSIDMEGRARYAAPGDELVAEATTYVVTLALPAEVRRAWRRCRRSAPPPARR